MDAMASLIVKELNQMSIEEREAAYEDVHGVRNHHRLDLGGGGDDDDLDTLIEDVKREIAKIRVKTAYDRALFMCPSFVNDPKFLIMFLRAEEYNAKKAADRIVMHFTCKLRLFGMEKLVKKITLEDLGQGELDVIASGCFQMSSKVKDMTGRTLAVAIQELFQFKGGNCMHHIRTLWYLSMVSVEEDEDAQLNGFVLIRFCVGSNTFDHDHLEYVRKCKGLVQSLPIKVRGFHFCYDDDRLRPIMAAIQLILGRQRRVRFRAHFGSRVECLYALMGFGIRKEAMPFDRVKEEGWYENYIQSRMQIESQFQHTGTPPCNNNNNNNNNKILYPKPVDILLGRGRPFQDFPGNLALANLVEEHRDAYQKLTKSGKTQMTTEMTVILRNHGGTRFLRKDDDPMYDGYWVEVMDGKLMREKVSHAFRTQTQRSKSGNNNTTANNGAISDTITESARKAISALFWKLLEGGSSNSNNNEKGTAALAQLDELGSPLTRKKQRTTY